MTNIHERQRFEHTHTHTNFGYSLPTALPSTSTPKTGNFYENHYSNNFQVEKRPFILNMTNLLSCFYITIKLIATFVLLSSLTILTPIEAKSTKAVPIKLDENNWTQLLQGEWMFGMYAPWCPACKRLEPEWRKLAEWSDDLNINVASADVTTNPALSGRFMVRGLPTIYHVKDGVFRIYNGPREHTALLNFVEEQGWKSVEPVSRWLAPNTLQMSFLAYSFRISMTLRDVHNHLVENVGLPYYISYLIFALCTVTLGTILGLVIVFVIDLFCPARYSTDEQRNASSATSAKNASSRKKNDGDVVAVKDASKSAHNNEQVRRRANKN